MSSALSRALTGRLFTMAGTTYIQDSMSVPTSATVIPLGGVTNPHWAFFMNMDPTNYIQIQNGASGAVLLRLQGGATQTGEFAFCPLDQGAVPYAIANTAACIMEYLILAA